MGDMTAPSMQRDALVTGEAVLLDLRPAPFTSRMISGLIDIAIQLVVLIASVLTLITIAQFVFLDEGMAMAGVIGCAVFAYVGCPVLWELVLRGRSPGRLVMGTRLVREDGGPVHVRQSVIRAVMAVLEIWVTAGAVALTCAMLDPRSRRVGDLMAGTMVVQERMATPIPLRAQVPVDLEQWVHGADVGRLPLPLMQDVRTFIQRSHRGMNPYSRREISRDLLQRTLPFVAPAPPPGTAPEAFLEAVIAERSRRDEERLRRDRERQEDLTAQVTAVPFHAEASAVNAEASR